MSVLLKNTVISESLYQAIELVAVEELSFEAWVASMVGQLDRINVVDIKTEQLEGEYCTSLPHMAVYDVRLNREHAWQPVHRKERLRRMFWD